MPKHAGFNGRVLITALPAGTTLALAASHWSVNEKVEPLDVTNFASAASSTRIGPVGIQSPGRVMEYIPGLTDIDISLEGNWDDNQDFFSVSPNLEAGDVVKIELWPDFTAQSGKEWIFNTALITDCTMDCDVHGVVKYTIAAKNTGTYTLV